MELNRYKLVISGRRPGKISFKQFLCVFKKDTSSFDFLTVFSSFVFFVSIGKFIRCISKIVSVLSPDN
jgi:hypothetical protein